MPTSLPQLLGEPISWRDWLTNRDVHALLSDLQANILKGHGRDHTGNIFVSFNGMPAEAIAGLLRRLAPLVTSALRQLREVDAYKTVGMPGGRVVCLFLARGAYEKLGVPEERRPSDEAFRAGMQARGQLARIPFAGLPPLPGLNDPPPNRWGSGAWTPGKPEPDAMILVADDDPDRVTAGLEAVERVLGGSGARLLGVERGLAQRRKQPGGNPKGEGIEQFGYVDGRSQPLFLREDIDREPKEIWDPAFPSSQFLVRDPAGRGEFSCGSYFVFRKLEQDVKRFKQQEDALAEVLGLEGEAAERAGALVVGRFEDGTPVVASGEPQAGNPGNDFDFKDDPEGKLCPFRGHIRKTNPRGESDPGPGGRPPGLRAERERLMARRGITYGVRKPRTEGADFPEDDRPERDVGLLFMAYMADIQEQFEFTQAAWAGNGDFVRGNVGIDPVIGQRDNRAGTADVRWRDERAGGEADFNFKTAVTLLGGEYFFAPSIGFLYGSEGTAT